jgi:F-type H+-transporting ATPase subunit epsilon
MKLKILLPTEIFLDREVKKITAEAKNGYFTLLPRHVDFVTALVPGIFYFETMEGQEEFLAIDESILVKCGAEVLVSSRNIIKGASLETLQKSVAENFQVLDEQEKKARLAIASLEANIMRRFVNLEK